MPKTSWLFIKRTFESLGLDARWNDNIGMERSHIGVYVQNGDRILTIPKKEFTEEEIRNMLTVQAVALMLRQKGISPAEFMERCAGIRG